MSFFRSLARHKYKFAIFGLLVLASLTSVLLALARMAYSDTREHATLIWNLFLAWIPFGFASLTYIVSWSRKLLFLVVPVSALVWLLFFPNAPYILTDFQHLIPATATAPLWFDVIMLIWFAWTGLLLGVVSLYLVHEVVARNFGRVAGWVFAMGVATLGSLGIYLGRFLRWNSWDVLQEPLPLARDLWHLVRYPFSSPRIYGFTLLYTLLFLFVYLAFHFFGRMVEEHTKTENEKQKA
jgi:uncharacterized membrane protein